MTLIKSITSLGSVQSGAISRSTISSSSSTGSSFNSNDFGANQNSSLADIDIGAWLLNILGISIKAKVL
ncbi:hypothetical protein CYY_007350 [Polysphondylium violaceum]|uniref:Uncharacterized protein n=1 Tax=Polysphondylium violaceum TaxID=133409 RepID=A0A8J4PPR7_9MYCE|nr:hypothetical protein CYY_007350 [Polysphondylium violaceum]